MMFGGWIQFPLSRGRWFARVVCFGAAVLIVSATWLTLAPGESRADDAPADSVYGQSENYDYYYQHPENFGQIVGEFNGVPIYCNGPKTPKYFSNEKYEYKGYITGYKWQCVEYVVRFYKHVYGLEIRGGDAYEWFDLASEKELKRFPNGDRYAPQAGDILCSESGRWGHVGIIREVGPDYVVVIQQNWSNAHDDGYKRAPMTVHNGVYTIHPFPKSPHYKWQGWMRSKTPPLEKRS